MKPVALVSMPTLAARFPSFQLALLTPTLRRAGIDVEPMSLFLRFGERIGWRCNEAIADVHPCMVGEWIWSTAAFGDRAGSAGDADRDEYLLRYRSDLHGICAQAGCRPSDLLRLRDETAPAFVEEMASETDWSSYGMVGFTVVFQQMVASLALAKAIRRRHPDVPIVFGGATFEDDIAHEIIARNPQVDYVHCGDADHTLPEIVGRIQRGEPMTGMPGMMWRDSERIVYSGRAPNVSDLDSTPVPDFDEYYATRAATGYDRDGRHREVMLPIETARGCWYGMKHHCTFCGLNRAGMEFRRKSPEQVLDMLKVLSRRYGTRYFNAIDNIMAPAYVARLFGRLEDSHSDLRLHYEIRPKLSRDQIGRMRRGGLYSVQPGIESFSTHVLTLMAKNTTAIRNLELLKWTTYHGIDNRYNILFGFPGETDEDYRGQAEILRRIPHLQPPYAMARARPDRGSPMREQPELHSISRLRPSACYRYIYPHDYDLRRVSYFFDHTADGVLPDEGYTECQDLVADWKKRWSDGPRPALRYVKTWDSISIHDDRGPARRSLRLDDEEARLYELCADARDAGELRTELDCDADRLDKHLRRFCDEDLMIAADGKYLALALPENPYW